MKIYITKIEPADRDEFLDKAVPLLSEERRRKTESFLSKEDKVTSAAAELLLGFAVYEYLLGKKGDNIDVFSRKDIRENTRVLLRPVVWRKLISGDLALPYTISYKEKGKPYFVEDGSPEFNLSHSGNVVTLAVSNMPVGIDVEKKRNISGAVIKKAFSENDIEWIYSGKNDDEVRNRFLRAWTLKEAYQKMQGESVFTGELTKDLFNGDTGEISERIINDCTVFEEMYDMYTITAIRKK